MNRVEIDFKTLQKLCKNSAKFHDGTRMCCEGDDWHECDPWNCPYCELKDEDDLK